MPCKTTRLPFARAPGRPYVFTEFLKCLQADNFPKIFLNVGCNHPVIHSNSYFFERNQGYRVIAIDALHEAGRLWAQHRPSAQLVQSSVGPQSGETSFDVVERGDIESMFSFASRVSEKSASTIVTKWTVKVRRLADIVSALDLTRAGIVSMGTAGNEYRTARSRLSVFLSSGLHHREQRPPRARLRRHSRPHEEPWLRLPSRNLQLGRYLHPSRFSELALGGRGYPDANALIAMRPREASKWILG